MAIAQNTIFEMLRRQLEEPTISDGTGGGSADANNNFSYNEKKDGQPPYGQRVAIVNEKLIP